MVELSVEEWGEAHDKALEFHTSKRDRFNMLATNDGLIKARELAAASAALLEVAVAWGCSFIIIIFCADINKHYNNHPNPCGRQEERIVSIRWTRSKFNT